MHNFKIYSQENYESLSYTQAFLVSFFLCPITSPDVVICEKLHLCWKDVVVLLYKRMVLLIVLLQMYLALYPGSVQPENEAKMYQVLCLASEWQVVAIRTHASCHLKCLRDFGLDSLNLHKSVSANCSMVWKGWVPHQIEHWESYSSVCCTKFVLSVYRLGRCHNNIVFVSEFIHSFFLHQTLHNAARRGDLQELKLVLAKKADINNKDDNGVCVYVRLYYWLLIWFGLILRCLRGVILFSFIHNHFQKFSYRSLNLAIPFNSELFYINHQPLKLLVLPT